MKKCIFVLVAISIIVNCAHGVMSKKQIEKGLKSYDRALHIKDGWIRDPFIVLAADGYYYLTGTTPLPGEPREKSDKYNTGLGPESIVGWKMRLWRSRDLIEWESMGAPYSLKKGIWFKEAEERFEEVDQAQWRLWAPELHFFFDKWVIVHTSPSPVKGANLSVTQGASIEGPFDNPMGVNLGRKHDPSLFRDDDGQVWLISGATSIVPLKPDLSDYCGQEIRIGPANRKMGHEGCLMHKIGNKYVLFGTGWSTDMGRKGSYNLYYCTADKVTGPYGQRKFAGRFLGHGTPFKDKQGRWWCTGFFNANVPPLSRKDIKDKDMSDNAYTINEQGVTIVPLDVKVQKSGEIYIRAKDPDYAHPGPEEAQSFKD